MRISAACLLSATILTVSNPILAETKPSATKETAVTNRKVAIAKPGDKVKSEAPSTKSIMGQVYGIFSDLLPLSVSSQQFTAKENAGRISNDLSKLVKLSDELTAHTQDLEFDYIGSNFKQDVHDMQQAWKRGRQREAQFIFRTLSTNCISCHTRAESKADSSQPKLFDKVADKGLSTLERAELKTAVREFNEALALYEEALSPKKFSTISPVMMEGYIVDYMIVALKVKADTQRVQKTLESLSFDPSIPFSLRSNIGKWISFLKDYQPDVNMNITEIESLINKGRLANSFPLDSAGVVANILGSKHLQTLLTNEKLPKVDQAQAYYLLGISELSINRPIQVSRANYFLEKAVRTAPKTQIATNAYSSLESNIYYQNSGSLGVFIPSSDIKKLDELRKLLPK